MILLLCGMVFGSFYLSYGVVQQSIKAHEQAEDVPRKKSDGVKNVVAKEGRATAVQTTQKNVSTQNEQKQPPSAVNSDKCAFRSYPKSRLYGLNDKSQPNFLSTDATYIRGELPIILNPIEKDDTSISSSSNGSINNDSGGNNNNSMEQTAPVKPCLDTTSWETLLDKSTNRELLPFTDGHNPSVVSLAPNPYSLRTNSNNNDSSNNNSSSDKQQQHVRLDPQHLTALTTTFPNYSLDKLFLAVTIFGNGQCKFGLSQEEVTEYNFSTYNDPPDGKRTVIAVMTPPMPLDDNGEEEQEQETIPFQILGQTTLLLERDVKYGTKNRPGKFIAAQPNPSSGGYTRTHQEFDDPRFFFHQGRLWVLYRNGPLFGYQDQIQNPVHFELVKGGEEEEGKFVAYVKASETIRVCCGRNIALISEEPQRVVNDGGEGGDGKAAEVGWMPSGALKALTWVDPVTVVDVDLGDVTNLLMKDHRQLSESEIDKMEVENEVILHTEDVERAAPHQHRRLGSVKKPKSNIHGTNGYLVPLPSSGELLGIAHFHRPEHRKESNYALHGHHYTHAFFTIARGHDSGSDENTTFQLKRISNEFLFRALSIPIGEKKSPNDGDIIQFASGLDVYGSDIDGRLVLSYGINDCEGAVMTISMAKLQRMLIEVEPGQEVVDLMEAPR